MNDNVLPRVRVLNALREHGALTLTELAALTGLSKGTVFVHMDRTQITVAKPDLYSDNKYVLR